MVNVNDFSDIPPKPVKRRKKRVKKTYESEDQRIERKIREYDMAKSRTTYTVKNFRVGFLNLFFGIIGTVISTIVALKLFGIIGG